MIDYILQNQDELLDLQEDVQKVEGFFSSQVGLFDKAVNYMNMIRDDKDYLEIKQDVADAMNQIRLITNVVSGVSFNYTRIPELNGLLDTVKAYHDYLLQEKRNELNGIASNCLAEIRETAGDDPHVKAQIESDEQFFETKKKQIAEAEVLTILDGFSSQMWNRKDQVLLDIEDIKEKDREPELPAGGATEPTKPEPKKVIRNVPRQLLFPSKTIENDAELEEYLESVREKIKKQLNSCDGIKIN